MFSVSYEVQPLICQIDIIAPEALCVLTGSSWRLISVVDPLMWHELRKYEVLSAILIKHKVIILGIWWI